MVRRKNKQSSARNANVADKSAPAPFGKPEKTRLDVLLVERGLAATRQKAQAMLMAGQVRVSGKTASKPGDAPPRNAAIEIVGEPMRYSSRGGFKLEGALDDFALSPEGRICLDVGSSTGGFTDCLLQRGARRVYAVDVNVKQLDGKLAGDARVMAIRRNARYLKPADIAEAAEFVTLDVSFISVAKLLHAAVAVAAPGADFLILVKPQFELDRGNVGKGGIVRDPALHEEAVARVRDAAARAGLAIGGVRPSRLAGAGGNREFFLHAQRAE